MAGSGFPPLPNIPYCCLPQESGPCLSTSVANGTHAPPRPRLRFIPEGMPPREATGGYPAFPPAIPLPGAGCIRVAHPSATLNPPKGILPYDLHVLGLPLAFILSQDQTLRCNIVFLCFVLNLGSRLRSLLVCFPRRLPAPRCAGLKLSKNSPPSPLPNPLPRGKRVQKYNILHYPQPLFSTFFCHTTQYTVNQ